VRCDCPQLPDVDSAARTGIPHGEPFGGDCHVDASGVTLEVLAHEFQVAQRGRHEQIGLTSFLNQIPRYGLAILWVVPPLLDSEHVLCGCGFMIHVERVHIGASSEQQFRYSHIGCKVEGSLAVSTAGVHHCGVDRDEFQKFFDPAQTRSRMSI
jgi:hypothetical protein